MQHNVDMEILEKIDTEMFETIRPMKTSRIHRHAKRMAKNQDPNPYANGHKPRYKDHRRRKNQNDLVW